MATETPPATPECETCGESVPRYGWTPATYDRGDRRIRVFCSSECRERFLASRE